MQCNQLCHSSGEMQSQANAIKTTLKAEVNQSVDDMEYWYPGCCKGQACSAELETREHHSGSGRRGGESILLARRHCAKNKTRVRQKWTKMGKEQFEIFSLEGQILIVYNFKTRLMFIQH